MEHNFTTDYVFPGLSALGTIAAAWIACIAMRQGKKIKELADIVTELKTQNEIQTQRFENERITTKGLRMPIFTITKFTETAQQSFIKLELKNVGLKANGLNTKAKSGDINLHMFGITEVNPGDKLEVKINFKSLEQPKDDYSFILYFTNEAGKQYEQEFSKVSGLHYRWSEPE